MKESLRRLAVASVYVSAVLSLFLSDIGENVIEGIFELEWQAYVLLLILAVIVAIAHKLVNWIFQKGE